MPSLPLWRSLMGRGVSAPPQGINSFIYALYQLAHNESSGAALSVNSAQCSGWTTRAVLESRWGDSFAENWQRLSDLAEEVMFDLVLYQGEPAAACYHAISSGHTQASQRVWQESLPYLQGVDSPWDKYAQDYEVTVQYTSQQVSDCLYLGAGHPRERRSLHLGGGHGVGRRRLCGQYHPVRGQSSLSGTDLRSALSLRSACFALSWQEDHFAVTTRGYGHGVGLSQEGARAMAAGAAAGRISCSTTFPAPRSARKAENRAAPSSDRKGRPVPGFVHGPGVVWLTVVVWLARHAWSVRFSWVCIFL